MAIKKVTGYLKIINKGEIDTGAFSLLGASTKRNQQGKIGYFGSGLKYAVAVLLREGIPFKVFSGEKEIKITTREVLMRDQKFHVIYVNGKATSLTTEMGPAWEPWFAVREIYCNAIDEGQHSLMTAPEPKAEIGNTIFYIGIEDKLKSVLDQWSNFFSEKREDLVHSGNGVKFYSGGLKTVIYRRGVQCFEKDQAALYHYDCQNIKINESRVIRDDFQYKYNVASMFASHASVEMIKNFYANHQGKFEETFYFENVYYNFSRNWLEALNGRWLVPREYAGNFVDEMEGKDCLQLKKVWIDGLVSKFGDKVKVIGVVTDQGDIIKEATEKQKTQIKEAVDFLLKAGVVIESPVMVAEFKGNNILGRAKNEQILLAPKLFEMGKKMIVATILEEHSHLETGFSDKTRGFQDYLLMKIVTLMEHKIQVFL